MVKKNFYAGQWGTEIRKKTGVISQVLKQKYPAEIEGGHCRHEETAWHVEQNSSGNNRQKIHQGKDRLTGTCKKNQG